MSAILNQKTKPSKYKQWKKFGAITSVAIISLTPYLYIYEHSLDSEIKISNSQQEQLIKNTQNHPELIRQIDILSTKKNVLLDSQLIEALAIKRIQSKINLHKKPDMVIKDGLPIKYNDQLIEKELFNDMYNDYTLINNIANNNLDLINHYLLLWNQNLLTKDNIKNLTPTRNKIGITNNSEVQNIEGLPIKIDLNSEQIKFTFEYYTASTCATFMRTTEYEKINESDEKTPTNWDITSISIQDFNHKITQFNPQELEQSSWENSIPKINKACNIMQEAKYTKENNFNKPGQFTIIFNKK